MFKDEMWIKWMFRFLILYILVLVGEDVLVLQRSLSKFDISWRLGEIWMTASMKTMEPGYLKCRFFVFFCFFSVRLLSVLCGHSVFSSPPQRPMTYDFEGFLYQILSITLFSYLNCWERASISLFNVEC